MSTALQTTPKNDSFAPSRVIRVLNRMLGLGSGKPFDLSPEAFRRRATRKTGLDDFGDNPGWYRLLEAVSSSLCENENLSPFGRLTATIFYQFKLTNKLRLVDLLKKQPEISSREVRRPIFIVGWYRTGTTLLHNMLASAPEHRAFRAWELITPYPLSRRPWLDRQRRKFRGHSTMATARWLMPNVKAAHPLRIDWPEEDFFLLENDLVGPTLFYMYQGADYARGLCEWDVRPAYRSMREQIQILSGDGPPKQLIFKAPIHLWNLDALMHAFPDARIVFTHRAPGPALLSNCSFSSMTSCTASVKPPMEKLGRFWLDYNQVGMQRATEARKVIPADQQIDVPLPALSNDPQSAVERIYEHFGIPFDNTMQAALDECVANRQGRPKAKHPHHYSAAQFGLDEARIDEAFTGYTTFYEALVSDWER